MAQSVESLSAPIGGVLGLPPAAAGRSTISNKGVVGFWYNLDSTDPNATGGEVTIGPPHPDYFVGEGVIYDTLKTGRWSLPLTEFSVLEDEYSVGYPTALIDTGTSAIALPKQLFDKINLDIRATPDEEGVYYVDCNRVGSIPPVSIAFGTDKAYTIRGDAQVVRTDKGCLSIFQPLSTVSATTEPVFGVFFIRQFYTTFDLRRRQIGIYAREKRSNSVFATNGASAPFSLVFVISLAGCLSALLF